MKSLGYIITSKGIIHKTELTIDFMNRKIKEYNKLKSELEKIERIKNRYFNK